tara:strand:+ start:667 stop:1977 length:1311 start_codon:yes stop_codon:yes gene_type:complete
MGLLGTTTQATYYTGSSFGTYQFVNLDSIINNFMYVYVGENKIISKVNRSDVQFHATRALQELSYDVLRSFKSQEIEVPNTLKMMLPQDYVNYVKLTRSDSNGIERVLYPTGKTSNPFAITQTTDGTYSLDTARRKIVITIPANGASDITDGDFISLIWKTDGPTRLHIIFDKDSDIADGIAATNILSIKTGIILTGSETQQQVIDALVTKINALGHHTATDLGTGAVQVVYPAGISAGTSSAMNTVGAEGIYPAGATGGAESNTTNMAIGVTTTGASSGETLLEQSPSDTFSNYKDQTESDSYSDDSTDIEIDYRGRRYGLDPQHAQINGTFYIDYLRGYIHFGSSLSGETIVLHYVSDGLGTDSEMVVHKFCEEACYKHIMYGVLSGRSNIPDHLVARFKKERFAETRKAKIRLSNIKIEEFTQILKGLSKPIK